MPLNEIPNYLSPETRPLIDSALEQAWQEQKSDDPADACLARRKLAGTISEAVTKTCEALEDIRLSRAATQHAIEQSRKSVAETHALLIRLRYFYLRYSRRRLDNTRSLHRFAESAFLTDNHRR